MIQYSRKLASNWTSQFISQEVCYLAAAFKKSRIRETKHHSTDADSSTNAIGGWIPKKSFFLKNGKNHSKRKNSKTSRDMPKLAICTLTRCL